jgi:hypothetical protein
MPRGAPSRERLQRAERVQRQMERERERKHRKAIPPLSASGGTGTRVEPGLAAAHDAGASNLKEGPNQ